MLKKMNKYGEFTTEVPCLVDCLIRFLCVTRLFLQAAFCPGLGIDTRHRAVWIGICPKRSHAKKFNAETPRRRE
jgi:hypothetical protein